VCAGQGACEGAGALLLKVGVRGETSAICRSQVHRRAASERRVSCEPQKVKAGQGRAKVKVKAKVKARAKAPQAAAAPNPSSALVSSDGWAVHCPCACGRLPNLQQSAALCSAGAQDQVSCILHSTLPPPHPLLHAPHHFSSLDKYCKFTALAKTALLPFTTQSTAPSSFHLPLLSSFSRRNFPTHT
jgi:hypothetical protein